MSFLRSSISFTQFIVADDIPTTFWPNFQKQLAQFTFRDIDNSAEEQSYGWVSFEDMLDLEWLSPHQIGQFVVFSLRVDTRRLPPAIFKKYYTLKLREEQKIAEESGKKYVSKDRKQELKELVRLQLFTRILPLPAQFYVVWSLKKNRIYFSSVQAKVIDLFTEYFMRSFQIEITQIEPLEYAYALLPEEKYSLLDTLETTDFSIKGQ